MFWINLPSACMIMCYIAAMTILEKFLSFANALPAKQLGGVEDALAEIMESYSDRYAFSEAERDIIDQRVAEEHPTFAQPDNISKLFGKPVSA
jgi:hypothetical protein